MDVVEVVALALPWVLVALLGWLVSTLVRQHGATLVRQDEFTARLAATERALERLTQTLESVTVTLPTRSGDGQSAAAPTLEVGAPAPDFSLPDLEGQTRSLGDFLGRPLLVVFFDAACGFCQNMAPRLGAIAADGPRVLLVSRGDPGEHQRLAEEHAWRCDVVLEPAWEVAGAYRAGGTPTGYLLDAEGRVTSGLAVGADALLALLDRGSAGQEANGHGAPLTAEGFREKEHAVTEIARAGGPAVRDVGESRLKRDGLPAGTLAPDFDLPDLNGHHLKLRELRGKRVLLVFSDVGCGPCQEMAPDLVQLHERHRDDGLEVVMVSRGDLDANRTKAAENGYEFPVLLQRSWEVSKDYAMFATPIAYVIDEEGVIITDVAIGAPAILGLVSN